MMQGGHHEVQRLGGRGLYLLQRSAHALGPGHHQHEKDR